MGTGAASGHAGRRAQAVVAAMAGATVVAAAVVRRHRRRDAATSAPEVPSDAQALGAPPRGRGAATAAGLPADSAPPVDAWSQDVLVLTKAALEAQAAAARRRVARVGDTPPATHQLLVDEASTEDARSLDDLPELPRRRPQPVPPRRASTRPDAAPPRIPAVDTPPSPVPPPPTPPAPRAEPATLAAPPPSEPADARSPEPARPDPSVPPADATAPSAPGPARAEPERPEPTIEPTAASVSPDANVPPETALPPDARGDAHVPQHVASPVRRSRLVAAGVAALVVVAGGAVVAAGLGDDASEGADRASVVEDEPPGPSTTTTTAPVPAPQAFDLAARRLTEAGTFSYTGTVSATDVSPARPMLWLAVESRLTGKVATSTGGVHEVATAADGSSAETVVDGPRVWGRRATTPDALAAEAYEVLPGLTDDGRPVKGLALLPTWLDAAVDPADAGQDATGRRILRATLPAEVFGVIERERTPVDATVLLVNDAAGDPVRVEITSAPEGPPFHLVIDLMGVGDPVTIPTP